MFESDGGEIYWSFILLKFVIKNFLVLFFGCDLFLEILCLVLVSFIFIVCLKCGRVFVEEEINL